MFGHHDLHLGRLKGRRVESHGRRAGTVRVRGPAEHRSLGARFHADRDQRVLLAGDLHHDLRRAEGDGTRVADTHGLRHVRPDVDRRIAKHVVPFMVIVTGPAGAIRLIDRVQTVVRHPRDPGKINVIPRVVEEPLEHRLLQHVVLVPVGVHGRPPEGECPSLLPQPGLGKTLGVIILARNARMAAHKRIDRVRERADVRLREVRPIGPGGRAAVSRVDGQRAPVVDRVPNVASRCAEADHVQPVRRVARAIQIVRDHVVVGPLGHVIAVHSRHEGGLRQPIIAGPADSLMCENFGHHIAQLRRGGHTHAAEPDVGEVVGALERRVVEVGRGVGRLRVPTGDRIDIPYEEHPRGWHVPVVIRVLDVVLDGRGTRARLIGRDQGGVVSLLRAPLSKLLQAGVTLEPLGRDDKEPDRGGRKLLCREGSAVGQDPAQQRLGGSIVEPTMPRASLCQICPPQGELGLDPLVQLQSARRRAVVERTHLESGEPVSANDADLRDPGDPGPEVGLLGIDRPVVDELHGLLGAREFRHGRLRREEGMAEVEPLQRALRGARGFRAELELSTVRDLDDLSDDRKPRLADPRGVAASRNGNLHEIAALGRGLVEEQRAGLDVDHDPSRTALPNGHSRPRRLVCLDGADLALPHAESRCRTRVRGGRDEDNQQQPDSHPRPPCRQHPAMCTSVRRIEPIPR